MSTKLFELIALEQHRQEETINLIASENYVSKDILKATGSILTNKYAEGYPGRRYYGGCEVIDMIESWAQEQGKTLFGAEHINVQPHSGSSANMAAYLALLKPGDTVLGMSLRSGGHLTHGHSVNFSGKLFNFVPYHVNPQTELLDYDEINLLANQHQPKLIVVGASAYSRQINYETLSAIAKNNKALLLADIAHVAGLIAAGEHPSPTLYADIVTSTTHKTLRGPRGGFMYCKADLAQAIDKGIMPGSQGGPLMHVIAAKGLAFEAAKTEEFKSYQQMVRQNATTMADTFKNLGYRLVAGGTDTHLFLVDLKAHGKQLSGKVAEETLQKCHIILNRNQIPFDKESPINCSGIRIGTPAITTRGFGQKESEQIVHWIDEALHHHDDDTFLMRIKQQVIKLCREFPIY